MSIQAALSNALSSLAAEQRQSSILANNIANANTSGYVRREMPRSERLVAGVGAGVTAGTTQRMGDAALAAASRVADGLEGYAKRMKEALETYNSTVGQPSDDRSLSSKLGAFEEALTTLSSAPDNAVAQSRCWPPRRTWWRRSTPWTAPSPRPGSGRICPWRGMSRR
ncbi:flagellar basal body protein [Teichococcus aestuarii]|uniref:flagellar basal body protein n=1 Tax=Teichococcus aestuarii TaxID=568898 RepID=UPI00361952DE